MQVQILPVACQKFTMVRISGNVPGWKQNLSPFVLSDILQKQFIIIITITKVHNRTTRTRLLYFAVIIYNFEGSRQINLMFLTHFITQCSISIPPDSRGCRNGASGCSGLMLNLNMHWCRSGVFIINFEQFHTLF